MLQVKSIKVNFSNFNDKNGRVKLGFPDKESMDLAKGIIESSSHLLWCYEPYEPSLLLPKLTIFNVPLDFDFTGMGEDTISELDFSKAEIRDVAKVQILNSLRDKNDSLNTLINTGLTLDVVYIQKHRASCTVALKVSPELRQHIMETCHSKFICLQLQMPC